jgi:hypothetical protein
MANQNIQNQGNQSTSGQSGQGGQQGGKIDNVLYNVITVLHEKSKGLEAYDKYDRDLQGRNEIKQIFDEIRRNDEQAVQRLQDCLRQLLGSSQGGQQNRAA